MSNIGDGYEMEAGTSGLLETCDESRILIETVGNMVGENNAVDEKYFVVTTDVDGEQKNLIRITEAEDKLDGDNSIRQNECWAVLCRICANTSDHLIPIFKDEGLEHDFNNKIQRYLPIQVSEEDNLPLQLCYHCAATLLAWHDLVDSCLEAEQRLLQMKNEVQHKNQSKILCESLETGALTTEDAHLLNKNQAPKQELLVKGEQKEESTANDTQRFNDYVPSSPSTSFTKFRSAYRTLLQFYPRKAKPLYPSAPKSDQWSDVNSLDNLSDRHSPAEANGQTLLPEKQLPPGIIVERNVTDVSTVENVSTVIMNNSTATIGFSKPIVIENHIGVVEVSSASHTNSPEKSSDVEATCVKLASVSANVSYDCKLCSKKFELEESLRTHMNVHTETKRYTCHICGKQFGQTGSLYYHLKHVHGGVKQHSCDICGRSFAMKAAMEDHRRIHTGERPYCCASCGKTFKTKASLYIHSKIHTDELPHKCSYCPKAFRWRQQMLGHLTIHTGQKNHICEICGKRFGVKNDLTRHKRIHSEEKPFVCQQCGLSFGQKRYLKNHERTRHR